MITFEDYMQEQFQKEHPMVLDDDMPDKYSAWIETLDTEEVWNYAEKVLKEIQK